MALLKFGFFLMEIRMHSFLKKIVIFLCSSKIVMNSVIHMQRDLVLGFYSSKVQIPLSCELATSFK